MANLLVIIECTEINDAGQVGPFDVKMQRIPAGSQQKLVKPIFTTLSVRYRMF